MGRPPPRTRKPELEARAAVSGAEAPCALKLTTRGDLILLDVHVVLRADKTSVLGQHDGRVKVALNAAPIDGAANEALLGFFAKALRLPKRDVTLVRGDKSRQKTLAIRGTSEAAVRALCLGSSG